MRKLLYDVIVCISTGLLVGLILLQVIAWGCK